MFLLSHISSYIIHLFPIISLSFLLFYFLLILYFTVTFLSTFLYPFYIFISSLFSTLMSLFLYPFLFFFWLFLSPSYHYKYVILSLILYVFFYTKNIITLSLSHFFFFCVWIFYFCISCLGWWIFELFRTLLWVYAIWFCVFKLLSFFFLWLLNVILLHYKDSI